MEFVGIQDEKLVDDFPAQSQIDDEIAPPEDVVVGGIDVQAFGIA